MDKYSLEILQDHGLEQPFTFPIRETNTLDLISMDKPSSRFSIQSMAGISDHDIIHFEVSTKLERTYWQIPRSIYLQVAI